MAQNIKLKRSSVSGKVPTTSQLEAGEIAINTADGKLYFERDDASIQTIVTTNAVITGSLNINGPITGSDVSINQWGSVSASLSSISSQAAVVPTLDQVTDQGTSTTNFIQVGSITTSTTGGFIAGVFKTTDGTNTVILESSGSGGANPGSTILQFRDSKVTQRNAAITYGGNAADYLRLNTSAGTVFGITGSNANSTYVFGSGNNAGTGSFSWDLNTTFIQQTGGGTTRFLGNATSATSATSASFALTAPYSGLTGTVPTWNQNTTGNAATATSASHALTASFATSASFALTASHASNFNISGDILNVNNINFNTGSGYTVAEGKLGWDSGEGTLQLGLEGGNVTYALGEQLLQYVYNAEATTLNKGEVVLVSGSQGNNIAVKRANNSGDPTSAGTLGFAAEAIAAGADGWVITEGPLKNLNTAGLVAGGLVFLGSTPGTYTQNIVTAPSHSVRLGYVQRVHASVGSIFVKIDNGYELGELHDVVDTTTTASYGDLLVKQGNIWTNSRQLTGSYALTGSLTATGQFIGALNGNAATATTASYALKAESVGTLNQAVVINGDLQVFGTASFTNVTSSQLNVADSFISVNIFEPAERFGGLKVYDSGSLSHLATASFAWDSQRNHWVYQNVSGSTYTGGGFLSGPRNTGSLGDEPSLTNFFVPRSAGGDHLNDSQIFSSGSTTIITGSLTATGKVNINTVDNFGLDPDKFLALSGSEIVYRTGAQLLSDIGGQSSGTFVQNAGGGGVARSIMRYADSNSATTSSIFEDTSGNIGINKSTPGAKLDINGSLIVTGSLNVSGTGYFAGITSSGDIQVHGLTVGRGRFEDFTNVAVGYNALKGYSSGSSYPVSSVAIGKHALFSVRGGINNTAVGNDALNSLFDGNNNTGIGNGAGSAIHDGGNNTALGGDALATVINGNENTGVGYHALYGLTTGGNNIGIGSNVTGPTTGENNTIIGTNVSASNVSNNIVIGTGDGSIKYRFADNNTTISGSLTIQGTTKVVQEGIFVTGLVSLNVASINTGSYEGAFLDYVLSNGSNKRAGTLTSVWTSANIEWKDVSTLDLGSTEGAEFTPILTGSNARIVLAVPGGDWTVRGHLRYM